MQYAIVVQTDFLVKFRRAALEDTMIKQTLIALLHNAEKADWRLALYLPQSPSVWCADTEIIVEDPDNVDPDEPDSDPEVVREAGYRYVMTMQSVRSIVTFARQQRERVSDEALIESFLYYVQNDAYLSFQKGAG